MPHYNPPSRTSALDNMTVQGSTAQDRESSKASPRVFVAEDEFLLAVMLEDDLRDNGFGVVGPFTRLPDAIEAAASENFDIAVLDINMNGEMAYPIADALVARGIPFIFLSGYGDTTLPERLKGARCIAKPCDPAMLLAEIKRVIARH